MDVLNLERAPGGLHADQHSAIDRKVRRASVRAAVTASDNNPLALCHRVQNRQPRIGKVGLNLSEHLPHARTSDLSAMIPAVLREAAGCRVEVAAIERLVKLLGCSPVGLGNVQGSCSLRRNICGVDALAGVKSISTHPEQTRWRSYRLDLLCGGGQSIVDFEWKGTDIVHGVSLQGHSPTEFRFVRRSGFLLNSR